MKKLILTLSIAVASCFSYAQNTFPVTGNVGIGTTGPQHTLHVVNNGAVIGMVENTSSTADARVIAKNILDQLQMGMDNTGGYFQLVGANSLRTIVNNAERMRITSSGNVGIGAATPTARLQLGSIDNGTTPDLQFTYDGASYRHGIFNTFNSGSVAANKMKFFVSDSSPTGKTTVMTLQGDGNVGIGTTSPSNKLTIQADASSTGATDGVAQLLIRGNTSIYKRLAIGMDTYNNVGFIKSDNYGTAPYPLSLQPDGGNVGIGTSTPSQALEVAGNVAITGTNGLILNTSGGGAIDNQTGNLFFQKANGAGFIFRNTSPTYTEYMRIDPSGNLLIGKTTQSNAAYKLDINGSARANEVVVNTTGADFVFQPDYKLPKLSEVKNYIDQNHHLPEIPSANEMQKNGMSIGELNTKLLQKVEELTLYLIEENRKNKEQEVQINQLKEQVTALTKAKN